jgi:hypothetical protein
VRTSAEEVCQATEEVEAEHPEYTAVQITKQLQEALPQERMLYEQVNAYLRSIGFGKQATRAPRTPEESTRVEQSIRVRTHSTKTSEERAKLELGIELKRDPKIQGNPAAAIVQRLAMKRNRAYLDLLISNEFAMNPEESWSQTAIRIMQSRTYQHACGDCKVQPLAISARSLQLIMEKWTTDHLEHVVSLHDIDSPYQTLGTVEQQHNKIIKEGVHTLLQGYPNIAI